VRYSIESTNGGEKSISIEAQEGMKMETDKKAMMMT
jgi:hypothetical protein